MRETAKSTVRVVSRPSALALAQARTTIQLLQGLAPRMDFQFKPIASGEAPRDWVPGKPLPELEEKGGYVSGVRRELLAGRADVAIHCAKDMPLEMVNGLRTVACLPRSDSRDCLIACRNDLHLGPDLPLTQLPEGARIGTSSPRRIAFIQRVAPQCIPLPMRGNVDTRLRHLLNGHCDGLILSLAGLVRLRLVQELALSEPQIFRDGKRVESYPIPLRTGPDHTPSVFVYPLPLRQFVPSPGQGILVLEAPLNTVHGPLWMQVDHSLSHEALRTERQLAAALDASCHSAIGVHCSWLGPTEPSGPGWQVLVQRASSGLGGWRFASAVASRASDAADQVLEELRR